MKRALLGSILVFFLSTGAMAQMILSVGGALGFEYAWAGLLGDSNHELTCVTKNLEFLSDTSSHTNQQAGAFVFPISAKERFIGNSPLTLSAGIGSGLASIPTDQEDYSGGGDDEE
jgi:hypothetical protein